MYKLRHSEGQRDKYSVQIIGRSRNIPHEKQWKCDDFLENFKFVDSCVGLFFWNFGSFWKNAKKQCF